MSIKLIIIDYGMGNLRSIVKKFERLKISVKISRDAKEIAQADKLVFPGVGHFGTGMKNLKEYNLLETLNEKVLINKCPILGICLGMQLFAKSSEEGFVSGLEWLDATVVQFKVSDTFKYKVPHMGWNSLILRNESQLLSGVRCDDLFYFVHGFHIVCNSKNNILSETVYDYQFTSSVSKENIFGTQFHPEKSFEAGDVILRNFYNI